MTVKPLQNTNVSTKAPGIYQVDFEMFEDK